MTWIGAGLLIAIFLYNIHIAQASDRRIAVLMSQKASPYEEAWSGLRQYVHRQSLQVDYDVFVFESDTAGVDSALRRVKKNRPSLVFALGSLATEKAASEISDVPIVAGLVLRGDTLKKTTNSTGIFLEFPVDTELKWLQRMLPNARNIGAIYNPMENQERMEHAARVASKMGLQLETQKVHTPQDLPGALNRLVKHADVFWGVADQLVLNSQTAKYILLFSFQNRIPFVGLSSTWVKAGALYSLDWDYTDIGMQCGEMAVKILQGTAITSVPAASPRKVLYTLNLNTAQQMKIKLSDDHIRGASRTF